MLFSHFTSVFDIDRPEIKEGKEAETEKKAEQENNESDKIEKELEKDKVIQFNFESNRITPNENRTSCGIEQQIGNFYSKNIHMSLFDIICAL